MKNTQNPDQFYTEIEASEMTGKMLKYVRQKARIAQRELAKFASYTSRRTVQMVELQEKADPYWIVQLKKMYVKKFDQDAPTLWNENIKRFKSMKDKK